jgi:hypothetical protein
MDSGHVVIMKNNLQGMRANLVEENRRDCKSNIVSIDASCNRELVSIFNSDLPLVALGVLEGWDCHWPNEIQMDAYRRISMRCYVLWRPIVHCDV